VTELIFGTCLNMLSFNMQFKFIEKYLRIMGVKVFFFIVRSATVRFHPVAGHTGPEGGIEV